MLAVILAAGQGTRLGILTARRSKAMMPIAGKSMIVRVMDMLAAEGAERFIVVVHPTDQELIDELEQSSRSTRTRLAYQDQRLGMADAVESAASLIREDEDREFLLASCDNLYPQGHVDRLITHHRSCRLDAALTLKWASKQEALSSALVVIRDGLVQDIIEKPSPEQIPAYHGAKKALTAPSLYVLSHCILDYLPRVKASSRREHEFPDALRLLIADGGKVGGQVVEERMTLTRREDLLTINRHFLQSTPGLAVIDADTPPSVKVVPPVLVEASAKIGPGCEIGPEVYLEAGATVREEAVVRRAVVLRGASVAVNQFVDESVIA
jgi:bifunctional UDP-N-acetylglucosamine pyrophosphorylase/glucosamine-1-phosphate N-acetyltransferase